MWKVFLVFIISEFQLVGTIFIFFTSAYLIVQTQAVFVTNDGCVWIGLCTHAYDYLFITLYNCQAPPVHIYARSHIVEIKCVTHMDRKDTAYEQMCLCPSTHVSIAGCLFSSVTLPVSFFIGYCEAEREMTDCRNSLKEGI